MSEKKVTMVGLEYIFVAALIASFSMASYVIAIGSGKASVAALIRSLSVVVTIIVAFIFLAEKVSLIKLVGLGFGVIAIILLTL